MSTVKINETTFSITSTLTMAQLKTLHTKAPQALQLTKPGKKSGDDDEIIFAIAPSAKQSMSTYGICFAKSALICSFAAAIRSAEVKKIVAGERL